jgi:hypothetical protein
MDTKELITALAELDDEGRQEVLKALGVEEAPDPIEAIKGLSDEQRAEIAKLLVGEPQVLTADDIIKAIESLKPEEDDKPQVPEEVTKAIKGLEDRLAKAEDRADKAEDERDELKKARRREQYIAEAVDYSNLPGVTADDFAAVLEKADDGLDEDGRKKLREVLKGANEQLGSNRLLRELGSDADAPGEAEAEIDALATEVMKADGSLSKEQARTRVMESRPDLAKRALEEDRTRIREREDRR